LMRSSTISFQHKVPEMSANSVERAVGATT
jgi:hypothetical protein